MKTRGCPSKGDVLAGREHRQLDGRHGSTMRDARLDALEHDLAALRELLDRELAALEDRLDRLARALAEQPR